MELPPGLYEALVTRDRAAALAALSELVPRTAALTPENAPHLLARHVYELLLRALRSVPGKREERLGGQLELVRRVVELLAEVVPDGGADPGDEVPPPGELLLELRERLETLRVGEVEAIPRPTLPLRQSDLIVNGPRDLRLGAELRKELASADRVDVLVSFLKHSGVRLIERELAEFCRRRPGGLRVLTTTYLGATEIEALDKLTDLGASVRISYESRRTRLHAKAWLFHRRSGFSTGLVGSSNLSHSALLDGLEWNVRLAAVDNEVVLAKLRATFDQYWGEPQFEPYERERFLEETRQRRDPARDALAAALQLRPYPHQQAVLAALEHERAHGHHRNLVVAATGTGKTVVAALDYARLRQRAGESTLLFVAHRAEILRQSLAVFRAAVRDGHFGELHVGRERARGGPHVFASIQSLHANALAGLDPEAYDVVIVDEFHHAEADTYRALLEHVRPKILLGLTATPERADGRSVLGWFDGRVAAELRLWDALDLGLLVPFHYFGVADGTDLGRIGWRAGRYDVDALGRLYERDSARADLVLRAVRDKVRDVHAMRALGFCVSVAHARFMARHFTERGVPSLAVTSATRSDERAAALGALRRGEVNALFSVDLFNEGLDVPDVDTVLFLRPTESATVFLQQLGRGLRLADGKSCLTVLDFIGKADRRFRFDRRFRALLRGEPTRAAVRRAIEDGFPHLPPGCELQLDRESQAAVLQNVRDALRTGFDGLAEDLQQVGDVPLSAFLAQAEAELEEIYPSPKHGYTVLKHRAGLRDGPAPDSPLSRALARLLHLDDDRRLTTYAEWLRRRTAPAPDPEDPLQLMLFAATGNARRPVSELPRFLDELWATRDLRQELSELFEVLADRRRRPTRPLDDLPFAVHATYSRDEVSAGLRQVRKGKLLRTQGGVYQDRAARADFLFVTLDKDPREFTPTTLYEDYPVSPELFHWESQAVTRADSETGRRYQEHERRDWRILLFVRKAKRDARGLTSPYVFLGPARYVEHEGEKPMRVLWRLERPIPPDFYSEIKLAAG